MGQRWGLYLDNWLLVTQPMGFSSSLAITLTRCCHHCQAVEINFSWMMLTFMKRHLLQHGRGNRQRVSASYLAGLEVALTFTSFVKFHHRHQHHHRHKTISIVKSKSRKNILLCTHWPHITQVYNKLQTVYWCSDKQTSCWA